MRIATSLAPGLLICVLIGCGSDRLRTVPVRGTVKLDGKAVPNGTIMFVPSSGPTATAEIQPDGSYSLTTYQKGDGAVPGNYTVVVIAMADTSKVLPEERNPLPPSIVPDLYTSVATSPLRAEVKDQENVLEFNLEKHKK